MVFTAFNAQGEQLRQHTLPADNLYRDEIDGRFWLLRGRTLVELCPSTCTETQLRVSLPASFPLHDMEIWDRKIVSEGGGGQVVMDLDAGVVSSLPAYGSVFQRGIVTTWQSSNEKNYKLFSVSHAQSLSLDSDHRREKRDTINGLVVIFEPEISLDPDVDMDERALLCDIRFPGKDQMVPSEKLGNMEIDQIVANATNKKEFVMLMNREFSEYKRKVVLVRF